MRKPATRSKTKVVRTEAQWEKDARDAARKMGIPEAEMVREAKRALMALLGQRIALEHSRDWTPERPPIEVVEVKFEGVQVAPEVNSAIRREGAHGFQPKR